MTNQYHNIKFIIKRTPNGLVLLVTGLWTLAWVVLLGTLVVGLISDKDKRADGVLVLFIILFFMIGLFICRVFLWHLRGKEIVEITDDEFIISHVGTIFPSTKKFEFSLIENIAFTDNSTIPRWIKLTGLGGGHIEFEYMGQKKYFGQTIELKNAKEIISRLVQGQKTTTH